MIRLSLIVVSRIWHAASVRVKIDGVRQDILKNRVTIGSKSGHDREARMKHTAPYVQYLPAHNPRSIRALLAHNPCTGLVTPCEPTNNALAENMLKKDYRVFLSSANERPRGIFHLRSSLGSSRYYRVRSCRETLDLREKAFMFNWLQSSPCQEEKC